MNLERSAYELSETRASRIRKFVSTISQIAGFGRVQERKPLYQRQAHFYAPSAEAPFPFPGEDRPPHEHDITNMVDDRQISEVASTLSDNKNQ